MSEDKELSGEEKRAKLKEEYKRELLERRQLMEQAEQAKKMSPIQKALDEIQRINDSLSGTVDDIMDKLNMNSAEAEARMEVALGTDTQTQPKPDLGTTTQQTQSTSTSAQSTTTDTVQLAETDKPIEKTLLDTSTAGTTQQQAATTDAQPQAEVQTKKTLGEQEH